MAVLLLSLWFATAARPACTNVRLPVQEVTDGCETHRTIVAVPRCSFGNAKLTTAVNGLVERNIRQEVKYDEKGTVKPEPCENEVERFNTSTKASCAAPFRAGSVVSYACSMEWTGGGARPGVNRWSILVDLTVPQPRELEVRDLLVDAAAEGRLWELVKEDIRRQFREAGQEVDEGKFAEELQNCYVHLSADGLTFAYSHYSFGYLIADVVVPYASLRGILKATLLPKTAAARP